MRCWPSRYQFPTHLEIWAVLAIAPSSSNMGSWNILWFFKVLRLDLPLRTSLNSAITFVASFWTAHSWQQDLCYSSLSMFWFSWLSLLVLQGSFFWPIMFNWALNQTTILAFWRRWRWSFMGAYFNLSSCLYFIMPAYDAWALSSSLVQLGRPSSTSSKSVFMLASILRKTCFCSLLHVTRPRTPAQDRRFVSSPCLTIASVNKTRRCARKM